MANQIAVSLVGSTNLLPTFSAQSPSYTRYVTVSTIIECGDAPVGTTASYTGGPVPLGFVAVQYHVNNQWKTATYYTAQNGSTLAGLIG